jgi:hypothetical protein
MNLIFSVTYHGALDDMTGYRNPTFIVHFNHLAHKTGFGAFYDLYLHPQLDPLRFCKYVTGPKFHIARVLLDLPRIIRKELRICIMTYLFLELGIAYNHESCLRCNYPSYEASIGTICHPDLISSP